MKKIFKNKIKFTLLISILIYIILNSVVYINDMKYDKELQKFDLNNDGFFTKNEINPEQQIAQKKVVNDTGRNLAPILLIPFSLIIGMFFYFGLKITERIIDKKNNYK